MRCLVALALFACVGLAFCDETFDWPIEVKIATEDNFHELLSESKGYSLAMFYAPWCGHCQEAKPAYAAAAVAQPKRTFIAVNCDDPEAQELCADQDVQGYPTFKIYKKGEFYKNYEDSRLQADFEKIVKSKKGFTDDEL